VSDRATAIILAMYFMGNPSKKENKLRLAHKSRRRDFGIGRDRASGHGLGGIRSCDRSTHDGTIAPVLLCEGADSTART
jgi:hypothetical protein